MKSQEVETMSLADFRQFLLDIPDEEWSVTKMTGPTRCVMSLLGVSPGIPLDGSPLAERFLFVSGDVAFSPYWSLINKTTTFNTIEAYRSIPRIVRVNRGEDPGYKQDTPKGRVLAYIDDLAIALASLERRIIVSE